MAAKKNGGTSDADWLLGAWEMAGEIGSDMGLGVQIGFTPTRRKGVWSTTVRVVHIVDGRAAGVVVQAREEYPNASTQGLGAHLLRLVHQVDGLLAEKIMQSQEETP